MSLANVFALIAIFLVLLVWAWKSGKWASDIKHALEEAANEASAAAKTAAVAHEGIARLEKAINTLPCHKCPIVGSGHPGTNVR